MERSFNGYVDRKRQEFGNEFDTSNLDERFIPYYENQKRIEVEFNGNERKRGRVSVTTGRKPVFILMLTSRSMGSSWILDKTCKIVREV